MQTSFIHLRVSSEFSISRGLLRIDEIIKNAQKLNMPAVALTDLNNMFGMVKFFKKAEAAGIKPLAGTTLNLKSRAGEFGEILCLAKNNEGLKSLMGIISKSQLQQENGYISVTFEDLSICAGNIVVIAGGPSSTIFNLAKLKKNQDLKTELLSFKETFQDDFCIELQRLGKSFEEEFIQCIVPLASEFLLPVIASNDTMFSQKEDFDIHETKVCINTGKTLNDSNRERLYTPEQYFKSTKDISNLFSDCDPDTLINNTLAIAQKCNVTLTTDQYFLPEYPVPKDHDFNSFLSELSRTQLDEIIKSYPSAEKEIYLKRLDYELTQIHATGFSSYFLIVADFIQWSKDNDVPVGPGRGSGAGSLVA
jgi:DNA polymerase-3 subunit alpha